MQRPRILHIFSRYGDVGGEEVCFRAITEELRAVADVPLSIPPRSCSRAPTAR